MLKCSAADGALLPVRQGIALCAQPRGWCHGAMVGEAALALLTSFAAAAAGAVEEIRLGPTVPPPPLAPPSLLPALLTRGVGDSLQCWLTALSLYWLLSACALLHAPSLIAGELLPACERRGRWHWWRRAAPDCGAHPAQMVSLAYALGAAYLFIAFLLVLMSRSAPRVRLW